MTINIEKNKSSLVLAIEGRLDAGSAPLLEQKLEENLSGVTELTFDMNKTEYISSAGLRVLLAAHKEMQNCGTMKLVGVCDEVMDVLDMTGFTDILTIE